MKYCLLALLLSPALLAQFDSRELLNQGVKAFKSAKYADAITFFEQAAEKDPYLVTTHLYLGMSHLSLYKPGADTPENLAHAATAESEFQRTLSIDPNNAVALASIANITYHQKKLDESTKWYERLIAAQPQDKTAYYTLGVIAWSKTFPVRMEARKKVGMRPEAPGPLPETVRPEVANQNTELITKGIANLEKAIAIDPKYDDAFAYLNLLYRERADLQPTIEAYRTDTAKADELIAKTLAIKKEKANNGMAQNGTVANAPPPPPPPPPTRGQPSSPTRIQVSPEVQAANILEKVRPVYPSEAKQARVQGVVRFNALIGSDGKVSNLQVVSGHPLLVPAAMEAVKQWVYRPTLLNGNPVMVQTGIEVNFTLTQ